jgi:serine/threonine protein phosphatase 1
MRIGEASLPEGRRIYAIGDVHGRLDCLQALLAIIERDLAERPSTDFSLVFVGDYTDRGSHSAGVVESLSLLSQKPGVICLRGNHDQWLEQFLTDPEGVGDPFLYWGGVETLASYGIDLAGAPRSVWELSRDLLRVMPDHHRQFLSALRTSYSEGDYFFCHAGVRPGVPLEAQEERDLLWIREPFLDHEAPFSKVVVHGHTPQTDVDIRANRINVDTKAWETGMLCCVVLEGRDIRVLRTGENGAAGL